MFKMGDKRLSLLGGDIDDMKKKIQIKLYHMKNMMGGILGVPGPPTCWMTH